MKSVKEINKGIELVVAIAVDSVEDLNLKPGDNVTALVKATKIIVIQ